MCLCSTFHRRAAVRTCVHSLVVKQLVPTRHCPRNAWKGSACTQCLRICKGLQLCQIAPLLFYSNPWQNHLIACEFCHYTRCTPHWDIYPPASTFLGYAYCSHHTCTQRQICYSSQTAIPHYTVSEACACIPSMGMCFHMRYESVVRYSQIMDWHSTPVGYHHCLSYRPLPTESYSLHNSSIVAAAPQVIRVAGLMISWDAAGHSCNAIRQVSCSTSGLVQSMKTMRHKAVSCR